MSSNSFKVKNSLVLTPKDLSTLVSPEAGDLACDINDSNKIKRYDAASASWVEVGSGGGVGGVDIFFVQDFESASLSSFTQTGLVLSQTDPLKGKVSALLTHQAAINQSFKQIIPVDRKFRGESVTLSLDAKSSASQGNLVIKITNETAGTDIVVSEQLVVSNDVSGAKSSVTFTIPESCASLSYTITALPEAGSPVSRIDDIICQLTQSVTIQSGLIQDGDSSLSAMGNAAQVITASTTDIPFSLSSLRGSNISYTGSSATFLKAGIYSISVSLKFTTAATRAIEIYKNGVLYLRISDALSADQHQGSLTDYFNASDVISIRVAANGGTLSNATTQHYLDINNQGSLKQVTPNSNQKAVIPTSELRMEGASTRGTGSDTTIVRFDNVAKLRGDAFEVVSNATVGTVITVKKAGKLEVSTSLSYTGGGTSVVISKNQVVRTALPSGSEVVAWSGVGATSNNFLNAASSIFVNVGDVIRVSANGTPSSNTSNCINLSFQEQEIQVSVSNTLPQFSQSDTNIIVSGGAVGGIGQITGFSSVTQNIGVAASYASNSYTILEDGIFTLNASGALTTGTLATLAFSLNGTAMFGGTTPAGTATASAGTSITRYFTAGSVITLTNLGSGGVNGVQMSISKVGKPNVTGVDVTPFVSVPQPDTEFLSATGGSGANAIVSNFSGLSSTSKGIIAQTASRLTALKKCNFSLFVRATSGGAGNRVDIYRNGSLYVTGITISSGSMLNQVSLLANAGDYFEVYSLGSGGNTGIAYEANAEALSDSILTAPETFSTDTASLTYAGSGTYTLSTLANAPVGTYITFTYAANTNTRTQTTTRPTQTDADMNANGIQIFARAYNAPSSAAQPAAIAIQIGKGMKGRTLDLYKSIGKSISGSTDNWIIGEGASQRGLTFKDYNELTGVLFLDAGQSSSNVTTRSFDFVDATAATSGYLVINASKSPALTGVPLLQPRIAYVQRYVAAGTSAGSSVAGAWTTVPLSQTDDPTGIGVTLASNQFTLPAGTYDIFAFSSLRSGDCMIRVRNITDGTTSVMGDGVFTGGAASGGIIIAQCSGTITISSPKVLELQYRVSISDSYGLGGNASNFGENPLAASVRILKVK